jgi:DNA-binding response OmpR family regulator
MLLKLNNFDVDPYFEESALADFDRGLYDLILIDVDVPGMGGFEMYKKMRKIDDKVKVCFIANNRDKHVDVFAALFPDFPPTSLAEKPVTSEDLLRILRSNLADVK